jgi:Transposase DDE domain
MASRARLHGELIALLRQHCPARDQRHLVLLSWMVAGVLLSQTVCFDHWKTRLPLGHCLAASWQRRCQRWLSNVGIDAESLYGPLILWAIQGWQNPGHTLHLALDTTMLWNRICVVVVSVVCHGRAIPLLWQTLEHSSASVSAQVAIGLLEKADRLLAGFGAITLLADRGFPCAELLGWLENQRGWTYVMRLPGDTEIHGTAAPLGCQVRRLRLHRGECRGFRGVRLWADGSHTANLLLAHPTGLAVEEPWTLISNAEPSLDLVWSYGRRFCCEKLFRDQKSGVFQLADSGLRDPQRIDRLLLVVAIAVLAGSLQGYALSLAGLRRQVDPHWKRGMSFLRIGLAALQMVMADATARWMAWMPIPLQDLEPCISSLRAIQKQAQAWFSRIELPPRSRSTHRRAQRLAVA